MWQERRSLEGREKKSCVAGTTVAWRRRRSPLKPRRKWDVAARLNYLCNMYSNNANSLASGDAGSPIVRATKNPLFVSEARPSARAFPLVKQVTLRSTLSAQKVAQGVPLLAVATALSTQPRSFTRSSLIFPPTESEIAMFAAERAGVESRGPGPARVRAATAASQRAAAIAAREHDVSWTDSVRESRGIPIRSPASPRAIQTAAAATSSSYFLKDSLETPFPLSPASQERVKEWRHLEQLGDLPLRNPALHAAKAASPPRAAATLLSSGVVTPRPPTPSDLPAPTPMRRSASARRRRGVLRFSNDATESVTFDSHVAFETTDGWFLTMHPRTGEVSVREPDEGWIERKAPPFAPNNAPIYTWRVASMDLPLFYKHGRPVKLNEAIWLVAIDGEGDRGWQSGAVLSPRVSMPEHTSNFNASDTWAALSSSLLGAPPKHIEARRPRPTGVSKIGLHTAKRVAFVDPSDGLHAPASPWPTPSAPSPKHSLGTFRECLAKHLENESLQRAESGKFSVLDRALKAERRGCGYIVPEAAWVPSYAVHVNTGSILTLPPAPGSSDPAERIRSTHMSFAGHYLRLQNAAVTGAPWSLRIPSSSTGGGSTDEKTSNLRNHALVAITQSHHYIVHQPARPDDGLEIATEASSAKEGDRKASRGASRGDSGSSGGAAANPDERPESRATTAVSSLTDDAAAAAPVKESGHARAADSALFVRQTPDGLSGGARRVPILITEKDGFERRGLFRVRLVSSLGAAAQATQAAAAAVASAVTAAGVGSSATATAASAAAGLTSTANFEAAPSNGGTAQHLKKSERLRADMQAVLEEARALRLGAAAKRAPAVDANGAPIPILFADQDDSSAAENIVSSSRSALARAQALSDEKYLSFELERTIRGVAMAQAALLRKCSDK